MHYTDNEGNPKVRTDVFKENKEFFKQEFVLQHFAGGVIAPGAYVLPFQYQLPADLPGVFYDERREHDRDKVKGAIMYKVKACLDVKGHDLEDKEFLVVNSLVTNVPQPVSVLNEKKFLFGGSGKLKMFGDLAKNVFLPGETVYVKLRIDNESKKDVRRIKVKLMREVTIKADRHQKFINQEMQRKVFPGCKPKSKSEQMIDFQLSPNMFPSTKGKYIECKYHIDIEADTSFSPDLELHPPIVLALLPVPGVQMFNPFASYSGFK